MGTISTLLRSHKPSRESKLSAAASTRSEPSRDSTHSETGAVATLVAFGHGGQSTEVPPCPATSQGTCPHLAAHTTLTSAWQGTYYFKPKRADDRGENEQRMLELFLVRG